MDQLSYRRHRFPPPITAFAFFAPYARAHAHAREGHDGSAVCGGGHTTSLARAAAMDRRSRLAAISTRSAAPASRAPPRGWHDFTILIAVSGRNVRSARLSIILWARQRWGAALRWASGDSSAFNGSR